MKNPPRLLLVATIAETIRAFLIPYACYFRGVGWNVDAMARGVTKCDDLSLHFGRLIDAEWSRSPFDTSNITPNIRALREAAKDYDIVHVHTPVAAFLTRLALRHQKNAPHPAVVYTAHGFHFHRGGHKRSNFIFRKLEQLAGKWTDKLIVINREDYDAALKFRIVPERDLIRMPGIGLDFARYDGTSVSKTDVKQIHDQLGMKGDDALFSMIAEFRPNKRHADAVNALAKMGHVNTHLAFAGDGPAKEPIQHLAKSLGLSKRVHFLGKMKDVCPLIMASRAVLIPSEREGLSRTGMEAACLGVPIIGSDARGVKDIVLPNRGLLFPLGDTFALRDAMQQMIETPYRHTTPDPGWRIENLIQLHHELYSSLLRGNETTDER
ncbi:MAG: glycosyltransferase [Synergistaceae bacterium]|jgi:glycosyltransferase involved in cell wall biosynthesis|nr:glycosyltransferase [Synergistaceae bacterium]